MNVPSPTVAAETDVPPQIKARILLHTLTQASVGASKLLPTKKFLFTVLSPTRLVLPVLLIPCFPSRASGFPLITTSSSVPNKGTLPSAFAAIDDVLRSPTSDPQVSPVPKTFLRRNGLKPIVTTFLTGVSSRFT